MIEKPTQEEEIKMRNNMQLRLGCINESKKVVEDEIRRLTWFCYRCNEDRIFCPCCVIPATTKKLIAVFL
jgi:hypothetical protein